MIIDPDIKRSFVDVKVGDQVQICVGFATLLKGNGQVTRVGRKNFDVLAESASGTWSFRREDGKAAPGFNRCAFVVTKEEVLAAAKDYRLGVRRRLRLMGKLTLLHIGEGEL